MNAFGSALPMTSELMVLTCDGVTEDDLDTLEVIITDSGIGGETIEDDRTGAGVVVGEWMVGDCVIGDS